MDKVAHRRRQWPVDRLIMNYRRTAREEERTQCGLNASPRPPHDVSNPRSVQTKVTMVRTSSVPVRDLPAFSMRFGQCTA
jgi:hypothetical protein